MALRLSRRLLRECEADTPKTHEVEKSKNTGVAGSAAGARSTSRAASEAVSNDNRLAVGNGMLPRK